MARKRGKKKPTVDVDIVCLKCKHAMRVKVYRKVVMPGTPAEVEFETFVESDGQKLLFDEEKPSTPENVKVEGKKDDKKPTDIVEDLIGKKGKPEEKKSDGKVQEPKPENETPEDKKTGKKSAAKKKSKKPEGNVEGL